MARKMSNMEEVKLPLGKRAARMAKNAAWTAAVEYKKSRSCMFFTSIVTLVSCIFYVVGTYVSEKYVIVVVVVEAFFAAVFLVDYILSVTAEAMWMSYIVSFEGIVDLLSIFPVVGAWVRWTFSLSFVRYLRLGKVTRVMQNHRLLDKIGSFNDVTVNAALLGLKITGLILMTTAIIYGVEQAFQEDGAADDEPDGAFADSATGDRMQWHDALYFTIVTLSTVGYGDVLPVEPLSRMLMIVVILFALTYVPLEVGNLLDIIGNRPKNRDGYWKHLLGNNLHVVLAMVPGMEDGDDDAACFNPRSLRRIIDELCHEDHGMDNESLWVVVMAPCPPSPEVLSVIRSPRYMSRIIYYRGSVMDPLDMGAVCAEYADCIFLYPHSGGLAAASHSEITEEKTTLAARSVQRYLDRTPTDAGVMRRVSEKSVMGVPCRTLVTVKELSSKEQLLRFGINHVICHDELKMSMLACATLFPAFLPFAINAMRSSSDYSIPVNNTGEVKEDRTLSGNQGVNASAAASVSSSREDDGIYGDASAEDCPPMWLRDYKRGMEYEVYSLALNVSEDSCLWGLTFSRAALKLYKESEGKVLLLAVVEGLADVLEGSWVGGGGGGGGGGSGSGTRTPADYAAIRGSARDIRRLTEEMAGAGDADSASAFVHATIFPGDSFVFAGKCNVLVLGEDKTQAERHLIELQKSSASRRKTPGRRGEDTDSSNIETKTDPVAAAAVLLTSATNADHADVLLESKSEPASEPSLGPAAAVAAATAAASGEVEEAEEKFESGRHVRPRAHLAEAGVPAAPCRPPGTAGGAEEAEKDASAALGEALGGGDETPKPPPRRMSARTSSSTNWTVDEEHVEQMEAVRTEMRNEDGIRWEEALEALTEATGQLNSLKTKWGSFTEACITEDPTGFFSKVLDARSRLDDALRVQTAAVPEGLRDHLVIIGAHPRLQYYVVAMRRQRPDVAIVVVTGDKESFFELREKVAVAKCEESRLNITKIYSVCGKNQDRATFREAGVADAEAVLLVSDEPNDSDVLLVSFELEQMLSELPPGQRAPKVLIDLHTDNSIYYCGNTLGRGGSSSPAFNRGGGRGRLKETSGLSAAGVWEWPLFAAGMIWTESIMEVFAVQTYFSTEFLAFFETLLQIRRPVLVGNELMDNMSVAEVGRSVLLPEGLDMDNSTSSGGVAGEQPPLREDAGFRAGGEAAAASGVRGRAGKGVERGSASGGVGAFPSGVPSAGQFDMLRVVSRVFRGKAYAALARELILRGAMPLGLYRPAGTKGSSLPYTQVNPSVAERLVDGDVVFVLRSRNHVHARRAACSAEGSHHIPVSTQVSGVKKGYGAKALGLVIKEVFLLAAFGDSHRVQFVPDTMSHVQAYLSDGVRGRLYSLERALLKAKDPYGRPWSEAVTSSSLVLLGSGGFGSVSRFQVDDRSPWKRMEGYVLKQVLPRRQDQNDESWLAQKEKSEKALLHEADMLMWAGFKGAQFVPRIVTRITVDGLPAIVMEHAGEKTLADVREAAVEVRVDAMAQVMCALIELRNLSMFHGDVKETNVVVSPRDDQGRPVENANLPNFHHYKVTLVDFGGAQICDEEGMVPGARTFTRGYIDLLEVVRRFREVNGEVPVGGNKLNAFYYDMFAWASMVAKMFPNTFRPDVHEIVGIRLKHKSAGVPAALEALYKVMRRATSFDMAERMDADTAADTGFYQNWLKNGLSRASASSRGVGASSSGGQATGNGGGTAGWGGGGAVGAGGGGAAGSGGGWAVRAGGGGAAGWGGGWAVRAGGGGAAGWGGGGVVGAGGGGAAAGAAGSNDWQPPHNGGEAAAAGPMSGGQSGGHQQSSGSSSSSTDDDEDHGGGAGGGQGVCHGPPSPANPQTDEETETDQLQQDEETETDRLQQDEAPKDDVIYSSYDNDWDSSLVRAMFANARAVASTTAPEAEQPATAQAGERAGGAGAAGEAIVHGGGSGGGGGSSSVVYLRTVLPAPTSVAPQAQGTESSAGTGSQRGAPLRASAANMAAIKLPPSEAGGAANVTGRVTVDGGGEGGGRSGTGSQHPPVGIQGKTAAGSGDAASIPPQEVPRSRPTRSATRRGMEGVAGGAAGGEAARVPSWVKTRRMIRELELRFASEAPGVRTRSMSRAREAGGTAGAEAALTTTGIKRKHGAASQPAATIKRPRSGAGKARQPATGAKRPPSGAGKARQPATGAKRKRGAAASQPAASIKRPRHAPSAEGGAATGRGGEQARSGEGGRGASQAQPSAAGATASGSAAGVAGAAGAGGAAGAEPPGAPGGNPAVAGPAPGIVDEDAEVDSEDAVIGYVSNKGKGPARAVGGGGGGAGGGGGGGGGNGGGGSERLPTPGEERKARGGPGADGGCECSTEESPFSCGGGSSSDISRSGGGFFIFGGCRAVQPVTVTSLRMYLLLLLLLLLFPLGSVRCETSTLVACFAPPMKHDSLASCGPPRIDGGRLPLRVVGAAHTSAAMA
eukprot:g4507.t1